MDASALIAQLQARLPGVTLEDVPAIDVPTIVVPRESIVDVCRVLRGPGDFGYTLLSDVTAVDFYPKEPRFEVVYHVVRLGPTDTTSGSSLPPARARLKVRVSGSDADVPTISDVHLSANWAEREIYDLFGITFSGHPDLRRILMPDDWEGFPLRKDYPVQVNVPVKIYEPLQVSEEEFIANIERRKHAVPPRRPS
jgi:NADH-quinone oxidoreductase subunit C